MYVNKRFPIRSLFSYASNYIFLFTLWSAAVVLLYEYVGWKFIAVPFLPVSLIGTALSFYLGFKNNASYDRLWEARKNWGAIVNDSRAWVFMLNTYLTKPVKATAVYSDIQAVKADLVNRHIAWLYAHKFYLRHKRQDWEHTKELNERFRQQYQAEFGISTDLSQDLAKYLQADEIQDILKNANPAAGLLNNQGQQLAIIRELAIIEDFRLFELQNHLNKLLEHQGKNERLKNFPYPLQYSMMLHLSLRIFCCLLPLGMLGELSKSSELLVWLTVPFSVIISLIFYFMEINSDYSETPFEGLVYDVPITSITRSIEIDMLQAIGITNTPSPITAKDGVLM